jgi:hypothetical protein
MLLLPQRWEEIRDYLAKLKDKTRKAKLVPMYLVTSKRKAVIGAVGGP